MVGLTLVSDGTTLRRMSSDRRRRDLGPASSAALPILWAALNERGWTDSRLASELEVANGTAARLLYGDRAPGRALALRLFRRLHVPLESWDEPCPVEAREH